MVLNIWDDLDDDKIVYVEVVKSMRFMTSEAEQMNKIFVKIGDLKSAKRFRRIVEFAEEKTREAKRQLHRIAEDLGAAKDEAVIICDDEGPWDPIITIKAEDYAEA